MPWRDSNLDRIFLRRILCHGARSRCYDQNFADFRQILKNWRFFSITNVMIQILQKVAVIRTKNSKFLDQKFGETIFQTLTSVPGEPAQRVYNIWQRPKIGSGCRTLNSGHRTSKSKCHFFSWLYSSHFCSSGGYFQMRGRSRDQSNFFSTLKCHRCKL
jgi:hypothetical protein